MVLFVWLFAVGAGIANACLLEARGAHSHNDSAASVATTQVPGVLHDHAAALDAHGDDLNAAGEACLKACDDGTYCLPKQDMTVIQNDPGPPSLVALVWNVAIPATSTPRHANGLQSSLPQLPLRVIYSRLAL